MKRREFLKTTTAAGIVTLITPSGILYSFKSTEDDIFENSFVNPPSSARPFTWWHWINGNVTKEGITLDLEAMAEVGIGGFQAFSADSGIPSGPAEYLSPLWIDLMQHASKEAIRLGLEFDMHNCMGWSSSGGSWITPELSMQQLVWSEHFVKGGKTVNLTLKQPFRRLGYYQDAIVLAFPSMEGKKGSAQEQTKITLNGQLIYADEISKFDFVKGVDAISNSSEKPSFLVYEFDEPFEARSTTFNAAIKGKSDRQFGEVIVLEVSDDGEVYKKVAALSEVSKNVEIPSIAHFPAIKAKYFRFMIPMELNIFNVRLSASESIDEWLFKSSYPFLGKFNPEIELDKSLSDNSLSAGAINPKAVIDITRYMNEQGELNWEAPEGAWTILRFGHTTTGSTNRPAEGKGLGLDCDKYSKEAFDFHFNYMLDHLLPAIKPLAENGNFGMLIDSYEVDLQNWTKQMPQGFGRFRGYEIVNYLPALTGRVVGNANQTERFLWDFRRTCADLMEENYQGRFVELCKKNNIISYTEPYNRSPFEQMQAGAKMDINLGEFWLKTPHFSHSIKLAASIQNMNGRQIVAAESFTGRPYYSKWQEYPFSMKAQGDFMFTRGLNRFIFHRYAHQPHPTATPGMTMGPWGFHFERTNTWFFHGKKWLEYAARCQFMLQQGVFVGDVMCFTGEEAPGDDLSMGALSPNLPAGFDFQFANKDILLHKVKIIDGKITLPDGLTFSLLLLPDKTFMTVEVAHKLRDLVNQGMILVGERPLTIPSLTNFKDNFAELKQLVNDIWGTEDNFKVDRKLGQGRVFAGMPMEEVIKSLGLKPDFKFTSKSGDASINYIHRKTKDGHIYFVANRRRFAEDIIGDFRVSGLEPELWDADSGKAIPIKIYENKNQTTTIPLHLAPAGSVLVVFRKQASKDTFISLEKNGETILGISDFKSIKSDFNQKTTNNFTVSLWVKPETDELMPEKLGKFTETTRYLSSYPVYPPPGKELFGEGHASFCLLVARNGVTVFEKYDEDFTAVLIAEMPISSWTHFATVYKDGVPSLYVNGKFIKKGVKSDKMVHPAVGEVFKNDKLFYYDGDLSKPAVFDEPLTESKVKSIFEKGRPIEKHTERVEPAIDQKPAWLYWDNGEYEFKSAAGNSSKISIKNLISPLSLNGEWTVNFPPNLGAPKQIQLSKLESLHTHPEAGVKYFSGTANYQKKFNIASSMLNNGKLVFLDLGRVAVIAEVVLNGQNLGTVWKPPYRIDVSKAIKSGENELQVLVTNQWPNRLIGDEQLPAENQYGEFGANGAGILKLPEWYQQGKPKPPGGRVTFSTWKHFEKDSPLLEAGLIGPVVIRNAVLKEI